MQLEGKVALITGAESGIGQGMAEAFAREGADVTINYLRDTEGAGVTAHRVEAAGRRALTIQADVGMPDQVERMFKTLLDEFGRIDILVNNAALLTSTSLLENSFEDWERIIRTNLHGPYLCSKQVATAMVERGEGGKIINITSVHAEAPGVGGLAYHVAKGGLRNLTRGMALELARHKINVNAIAPGWIVKKSNRYAPETLAERAAMIPWGRPGTPDDVANMAIFLASPASDYCTGSTYYVDGGWMLSWPPV